MHGARGEKVHQIDPRHVLRHVDGHVECEELAGEAGGVHEAALGAGVEDQAHTVLVHGRWGGHADPMVDGLSAAGILTART